MRLILIRHGQTQSNVDHLLDTGHPGAPLTAEGRRQAATLVDRLAAEPIEAIYSSDLTRARQTAEPTCVRFPGVPMAIWPIHEFTYLCPANWADTTRAQRRPTVEAYWQRADPAYVDGEGAESFSQVLRRADA